MKFRSLKESAVPLIEISLASALFDLATRTVKVYEAVSPFAAVTITVTVLSPVVRPVLSRTSTLAPTSSAVATTSTDVTP